MTKLRQDAGTRLASTSAQGGQIMRNGKFVTQAVLAFLFGASGFAVARQNDNTAYRANKGDNTQAQTMSGDDQEIVKMLHQTNQMEMEAGTIAKSNAGSKDVKD